MRIYILTFILLLTSAPAFTHEGGKHAHGTAAMGCQIGGCSGEICHDADAPPMASICIWKEEFACYKSHGHCERQADGRCDWTSDPALTHCLAAAQENSNNPQDFAPLYPEQTQDQGWEMQPAPTHKPAPKKRDDDPWQQFEQQHKPDPWKRMTP